MSHYPIHGHILVCLYSIHLGDSLSQKHKCMVDISGILKKIGYLYNYPQLTDNIQSDIRKIFFIGTSVFNVVALFYTDHLACVYSFEHGYLDTCTNSFYRYHMLEVKIGRRIYPHYDVIINKPLFTCREDFDRCVCVCVCVCVYLWKPLATFLFIRVLLHVRPAWVHMRNIEMRHGSRMSLLNEMYQEQIPLLVAEECNSNRRNKLMWN